MAFWGYKFVFDNIPCETFDLMLYDIGDESQGEIKFAHTATIEEEVVGKRWRPLFYGVKYENKLEFDLIFGVNLRRINSHEYLSYEELDAIGSWLAGHPEYKWLEIEQDGICHARYRVIITSLSTIEYGNIPYALRATVTCDSPYGYMPQQDFQYKIEGDMEFSFYNESSHNGHYAPILLITPTEAGDISIVNETDDNRECAFRSLPAGVQTITLDNESMVISADGLPDPYKYFNFNFFRLKKGYNTLHASGNFILTIRCEFPVCPGG